MKNILTIFSGLAESATSWFKAPLQQVRARLRVSFSTTLGFLGALASIITCIVILNQYEQQRDAADRAWIAQQISTIYEEGWTKNSEGKDVYQPKAHPQARLYAVQAYVSIVRHSGKASLAGAKLSGMDFSGINFSGVDLSRVNFQAASLRGCPIEGATLVGADFLGADLSDADLSKADLTSARFQGANLSGVKLRSAHLDGAKLGPCVSSKTDLGTLERYSGPLPSTASLGKADVTGAVFMGASVCGVDFSQVVGLERKQLSRVIADENTKLPQDLKRPKYWPKRRGEKIASPPQGKNERKVPVSVSSHVQPTVQPP